MSNLIESKVLGHDIKTRKVAFGNGVDTLDILPSAFGIEPAPNDGFLYARKMGEWVRLVIEQEEV